MPSLEHLRFSNYPAFPSDIPLANIPKISLSKLTSGDKYEGDSLFEACREYGFFLLELNSLPEGQELLKDANNLFDVAQATLTLDKTTLDSFAYNPPKDLLEYVFFLNLSHLLCYPSLSSLSSSPWFLICSIHLYPTYFALHTSVLRHVEILPHFLQNRGEGMKSAH